MSSCPCSHGSDPLGEARAQSHAGDPPQPSRRGFFHACIVLMTGIAGFIVAFPVLSFMRLPRRISTAKSIELPLTDLKEDQALFFEREGTQVVLIYTNREPKAFDAACTHLGCLVKYDQERQVFICPCHAGTFDLEGNVISGPPPKPLPRLSVRVVDNNLVIGA